MNYNQYENIDDLRSAMLNDARKIRIANKIVRVSGNRISLPLEGRNIDIVFYPAPKKDGTTTDKKSPLLIGIHGGCFLFGGAALDDAMWTEVSKTLGVSIASIDYRLCPDYKWDDSLKDCLESLIYLYNHSEEFGIDPEHISLMGQSAGASLAESTALTVNLAKNNIRPDERFDDLGIAYEKLNPINIDNVILLYPMLDHVTEPDKKGRGTYEGPICYISNELHCNDDNIYNPLVSPVLATKEMLKGHAHTIILQAEYDNLRQEAIKYGRMLRDANVKVEEYYAEGMPHGFFECGFKKPTGFELQFLGDNGPELAQSGRLNEEAVAALSFIKHNYNL